MHNKPTNQQKSQIKLQIPPLKHGLPTHIAIYMTLF